MYCKQRKRLTRIDDFFKKKEEYSIEHSSHILKLLHYKPEQEYTTAGGKFLIVKSNLTFLNKFFR